MCRTMILFILLVLCWCCVLDAEPTQVHNVNSQSKNIYEDYGEFGRFTGRVLSEVSMVAPAGPCSEAYGTAEYDDELCQYSFGGGVRHPFDGGKGSNSFGAGVQHPFYGKGTDYMYHGGKGTSRGKGKGMSGMGKGKEAMEKRGMSTIIDKGKKYSYKFYPMGGKGRKYDKGGMMGGKGRKYDKGGMMGEKGGKHGKGGMMSGMQSGKGQHWHGGKPAYMIYSAKTGWYGKG